MYTDSHVHLDGKRFDADRAEVIARANQAGVRTLLAIGNGDGPGTDTLDCAIKLAQQYDWIYATVGVHPHEAELAKQPDVDELERLAKSPKQSARGWLEVWAPLQTRPLTYFTFWMNRQMGAGDPLGYHLFNLLFHLAAVLLAWECLRRLLPERAALIAGVLFALHPVQAEAVNYVWARSIVLAALFCFAALWQWIEGRPWIALAWFAAALLAKEECAAFPLLLIWLDG